MNSNPLVLIVTAFLCVAGLITPGGAQEGSHSYSLATFTVDVTIPIGHRCMGVQPIKALAIDDPLEAHGFVVLGPDQPIVLVALDWCEVRNGAYDAWRDSLAKAAGTTRQRVLVTSLHQHDAPVTDNGAEEYLSSVGLGGEMFDVEFQADCINRTAAALQDAMEAATPVTHVGVGEAVVEKVASSRRVVHSDGSVRYDRFSNSGGKEPHRTAPDGAIDPRLKTISFWNHDEPLLAVHAYATHPMSRYGRGHVSADFVGMARRRRQRDDPHVAQIYLTGCSGDVTAGKYNDGSPAMRPLLANRIYEGIKKAWEGTTRSPLKQVEFRCTQFQLPFHEGEEFTREALMETLQNEQESERNRILAAMGLSSLDRIESGQPIDLPCVDLGMAQMVLFPGEAFVGYQLMAQKLRPDSFVVSIGYGECWTGYIPTKSAFEEGFGHSWRWVGPGSEQRIRVALEDVLTSQIDADEPVRLDRTNLLQYRDDDGMIRTVKTPDDWQHRRAEILRGMQEVMGPFPSEERRVPLDVRVEEESSEDGYIRRLITYQSEPGSRTPAYLCIPDAALSGRRKVPAVLCLHPTDNKVGHKVVVGLGGRAGRQYAAELARHGYVTLSPSYPHLANYWPHLSKLGYVSGTMKAIWDNSRGLDLLSELSFVETERGFAAIGHSLGGHNAIYTAAFDDRIAVVVSSCGFDSYPDYYDGDINRWYFGKGWCQIRYMPRMSNYRGRLEEIPFDFHKLLGVLAPRPLFVNAPLHDSNFRWRSVDECAAAARPVYKLLGGEGNLTIEHPDSDHNFPEAQRRQAYEVIDSVLRPETNR